MLTWMRRMGRRLGAISLLALLVRAIIPDGFMLAHADAGSGRYLTVELCDGANAAAQMIDLETGKRIDVSHLPGKTAQKHAPCVFAGAPAMAEPARVEAPVAFFAVRHADFIVARDLRPGRGIPAPPPPSTGPPGLI